MFGGTNSTNMTRGYDNSGRFRTWNASQFKDYLESLYGKWENLGSQSPYDYLENLRNRFNSSPLNYKRLPSGEIEASRSMQAPNVNDQDVQRVLGDGNLNNRWILPKSGFTDEYNPNNASRSVVRYVPQSDTERQGAYTTGVSNTGQSEARQSPNYFGSSAFNLPWRSPSGAANDPYAQPTPVFGATIDYSKGRAYSPSRFGLYSNEFQRFNPSGQTPPQFGGYEEDRRIALRRALSQSASQTVNELWGQLGYPSGAYSRWPVYGGGY